MFSRIRTAFTHLELDFIRNMAHSTSTTFTFTNTGLKGESKGRLGNLQMTEELTYSTPNYFVHTQAGSIPHLTPDVYKMSFESTDEQCTPPLQISIESTFTFHPNVEPSGLKISEFVGLSKSPVFLTVLDPLTKHLFGYNDKNSISVWTRTGRASVDSTTFHQIVSDFKPDFVQCLSDSDIDESSSLKKVKKSTTKTLDYLNGTLDKMASKNVKIIATIEMGWFRANKEEGYRTITTMLSQKDKIAGFLINGVENYHEDCNQVLLSEILRELPKQSPRIIPGAFNPHEIIEMVMQGVDLFDSSIVTKLTEEGKAFRFSLNELLRTGKEFVTKVANEDLPISSSKPDLIQNPETENGNVSGNGDEHITQIISLKDKRFYDDCSPILHECDCYACRKHTRSYIHHLFMTGELLGLVLLMSHNLRQFDRFFQAIRSSLGDDEKLNMLRNCVLPLNIQEENGISESTIAQEIIS